MPPAPASAARDLVAEVDRVGVPERRGEEEDQDAGLLHRIRLSRQRRPTGRPRHAPEDVELRPGTESDAVEDGQPDRDADPLFHPDQHDHEQRDRRQRELEQVEAGDRHEVAPLEEPEGHEDEHGGQRGQRHVLEHARRPG